MYYDTKFSKISAMLQLIIYPPQLKYLKILYYNIYQYENFQKNDLIMEVYFIIYFLLSQGKELWIHIWTLGMHACTHTHTHTH